MTSHQYTDTENQPIHDCLTPVALLRKVSRSTASPRESSFWKFVNQSRAPSFWKLANHGQLHVGASQSARASLQGPGFWKVAGPHSDLTTVTTLTELHVGPSLGSPDSGPANSWTLGFPKPVWSGLALFKETVPYKYSFLLLTDEKVIFLVFSPFNHIEFNIPPPYQVLGLKHFQDSILASPLFVSLDLWQA